jgi:hypothetical protein
MLVVILGAAATLGVAWYYVNGGLGANRAQQAEAPTRTLQNVREAAHRIEDDAQKRADDVMKRSGEEAPAQE